MAEVPEFTLAYLEGWPAEASAVLDRAKPQEVASILSAAPPDILSRVVPHLLPSTMSRAMARMSAETLGMIVGDISRRSGLVLLRALPRKKADAVVAALPRGRRTLYARALQAPEGSVGSRLTPAAAAGRPTTTAAEAMERIHVEREPVDAVFVVDSANRFVGLVPLGRLLQAESSAPLSDLMLLNISPLHAGQQLAALTGLADWQHSLSLPVVGRSGALIGALHRSSVGTRRSAMETSEFLAEDELPITAATASVVTTLAETMESLLSNVRSVRKSQP